MSVLSSSILLSILQVGVQGSSPELLSVDREINVLHSSLFSKHFGSITSFWYYQKEVIEPKWLRWLDNIDSHLKGNNTYDVLFSFRWLSMLSSHLSLGLPLGLFIFVFNVFTSLSIGSSFLPMTWPNHRSVILVDYLNSEYHITLSVNVFSFCTIWYPSVLIVFRCTQAYDTFTSFQNNTIANRRLLFP